MLTVGLTGGMASGKSTVAGLLRQRGAAVRDADAIVAELYAPGGAGTALLAEELGREVLDAEGGVDRRKLAARIAEDSALLPRVERLIHPLVLQAIEHWLDEAAAQGVSVAVVEAALLVETGAYRRFHRLVVVTAPWSLRHARLTAQGFPFWRFQALTTAQAGDEEKASRAHYLVDNSGSLEELADKVERLWSLLLADSQRLALGLPLAQGPALRL